MRKISVLVALLGLVAATAWATPFPHDDHVEQYVDGGVCSTCHKPDDGAIIPSLDVCKACHKDEEIAKATFTATKTHGPFWSIDHRADAKRDVSFCRNCHDDSGKSSVGCAECHIAGSSEAMGTISPTVFYVHRREFRVSHPIAARADQNRCYRCHQETFCNDCHKDYSPEVLRAPNCRKGFTEDSPFPDETHKNVNVYMCQTCHPDSVLPKHEWTSIHKREARRDLATCQACHPEGDVCLSCHSTKSGLGVNPHPRGFKNGTDTRLRNASDGKTCKVCH